MKVLWLVAGVFIGVTGATLTARTVRGGRLMADVNGRAGEFARAVADSYRARQAELGTGS